MPARTVILRPDSELLVVTWLGGQVKPDGITVVNHLDVGWEDNDLPLIQCARSGGRPQGPRNPLDEPRLDFDAYVDADKYQPRAACEIARLVEALLPAMAGATVVDADGELIPGRVTEVGIESGPSWRPDFNPKVHRYGLTALITVAPHSTPQGRAAAGSRPPSRPR